MPSTFLSFPPVPQGYGNQGVADSRAA